MDYLSLDDSKAARMVNHEYASHAVSTRMSMKSMISQTEWDDSSINVCDAHGVH